MVTTALQRQLRRIEFLLILAVSFLGGLVFGRDYGGEAFFAIVIFVSLGLIALLLSKLQSASSE